MVIDWIKVSEIIFGAVLSGIIGGITIVAAYLIGRLQSDINWKRELEQREKEQKEKEENEMNLRRIDEINRFLDSLKELRTTYFVYHGEHGELLKAETKGEFNQMASNIIWEIDNMIMPLFPIEHDQEVSKKLLHLKTLIDDYWFESVEFSIDDLSTWKTHKETFLENFSDAVRSTENYLQNIKQEYVKKFG